MKGTRRQLVAELKRTHREGTKKIREAGAPDTGSGDAGTPEDSAAPDGGSLPGDAGQPDAD